MQCGKVAEPCSMYEFPACGDKCPEGTALSTRCTCIVQAPAKLYGERQDNIVLAGYEAVSDGAVLCAWGFWLAASCDEKRNLSLYAWGFPYCGHHAVHLIRPVRWHIYGDTRHSEKL